MLHFDRGAAYESRDRKEQAEKANLQVDAPPASGYKSTMIEVEQVAALEVRPHGQWVAKQPLACCRFERSAPLPDV